MSPRDEIPEYLKQYGGWQMPPSDRPSGPSTQARAGFWRRFAASLIDGIVIGVALVLLTLAFKQGGYLVGLLAGVGYFVYLEGGPGGQTAGKAAMGIRVIDIDSGGSIGYLRAFVRYLGRIVSAIPLYLGYLWMLWDGERQCWHDKFANDVVIPTK